MQLPIRRHHPQNRIRPYPKRSQRREPIDLRLGVIQGPVERIREVSVGEGRHERDAGVQELAAVKGDAPLPYQDRTGGNEPGWEGEEGYAEDATWNVLSERLER